MQYKRILLALFLVLFVSSAYALYCSEGDTGGKLLNFTVKCFGKNAIELYCEDGSERPQCYKRKECDVEEVCVDDRTGEYKTGCKADCQDETTFVEITCEPLPLTSPSINLPSKNQIGYIDKNFVVEGFAADNQLIKDIYFESIPYCDLNQVKTGLGTVSASVEATFTCNRVFVNHELKLVTKDMCNATIESIGTLSVEKYCGNECVPRKYPQCDTNIMDECIVDGECRELKTTECESGCAGVECCIPFSCQDLGLECDLAVNNCGENISCGGCSEGLDCVNNLCVTPIDPNLAPQPFKIFGADPLLIAGLIIPIAIAIIIYIKFKS